MAYVFNQFFWGENLIFVPISDENTLKIQTSKRVLEPLFVFEFWIYVIHVSFGCFKMRNLVWLKLIGHDMVVISFSVFLQFQIANAVNEGKLVPEEIIFAIGNSLSF